MNSDFYDKDYYEHGIKTGKSCYNRYRWMPEETIAMATSMINHLGMKPRAKVLEIGCAFGYLVKALRLLGIRAWGTDISQYAINHVDSEVVKYCSLPLEKIYEKYDFCIAKDVFEHIKPDSLFELIKNIPARKLFVIVPLGEKGIYFALENSLDKSHVICEDEQWWMRFFRQAGWGLGYYSFGIPGIKEAYKNIPRAHGFFTLQRIQENIL